jgi:uncharacterized protein (DUF1015 family)
MPVLAPFRGLRYDDSLVNLDDVVAPPYDVVDPPQREALASRSPYNAVHLELPEPDEHHPDRYLAAAALLAAWRGDGHLRVDPVPALYPYRMTAPDGTATTGVIGALLLPPAAGEGDVLPHEETLPKPRSDRLDLLAATEANLSPIWGLSLAPELAAAFAPSTAPAASAVDGAGVRHELWALTDPAAIAEVARVVAGAPIVIADGHHRFETAIAYRDRLGPSATPDGAGSVMTLLVELAPEQLHVEAIHRSLEDLPPEVDLVSAFGRHFELTRVGEPTDGVIEGIAREPASALVLPDTVWRLVPRRRSVAELGSDLDTSLVAAVDASLPLHRTEHRNSRPDALDALRRGRAQAAVLLRPVTVEQIQDWAGQRRRMPPKSTLFVPKPRTGMVMRLLGGSL